MTPADEFHHAAANNYLNILEYFKPKFLLGLTATPERLDNKDVFALCDYNIVYELRLREAINKGFLVPFRYYGIYDETAYENIEFKNGKYNEGQLENALINAKRAELILNHYKKYNSKRALGFCSSRKHAEYMAEFFSNNKIKAVAVHSGEKSKYVMERNEAITALLKGDIQIIFSVDMFNEGLDVPSVYMVLFLRPTESGTLFLQQLGRGLRKFIDKKYLNVLDFIGNYKKANLIPMFLTGKPYETDGKGTGMPKEEAYPEDCLVDFQFQLIDLFKEQAKAEHKIADKVKDEFYRIKADLNHVPTRAEFLKYIDDDVYNVMRKSKEVNAFKNYLLYLSKINEANSREIELMESIAGDFINTMENTSMNKTYKMPVLLAFYNNGDIKMKITPEEIANSFRKFYSKGSNWIDLDNQKSTENYLNYTNKNWYNTNFL